MISLPDRACFGQRVPQLHGGVKIKITGNEFAYYLEVTAKSTVGQLVVIRLLFYCFFALAHDAKRCHGTRKPVS